MPEDSLELADPLDPNDVAVAEQVATDQLQSDEVAKQEYLRGRIGSYVRLFNNKAIAGDAKAVLADLKRYCRGGQTPWADDARLHALLTGRNEVYTRISQHMTMTFEELWELYNTELRGK